MAWNGTGPPYLRIGAGSWKRREHTTDSSSRGNGGAARGDRGAAQGDGDPTSFPFLLLLAGDPLALPFVLVLSPSSRVL